MMSTSFELHTSLPLPHSSPSSWRAVGGFAWRLHSRRTTGGNVIVTVAFTRRSQNSDLVLRLTAQMPQVSSTPVENLRTAPIPADHPYTITVHLPVTVTSHSASFPPFSPPSRRSQVILRLSVQVDSNRPSSPVDIRENIENSPNSSSVFTRRTFSAIYSVPRFSSSRPQIIWLDDYKDDDQDRDCPSPYTVTSTKLKSKTKREIVYKRCRRPLHIHDQEQVKVMRTPFTLSNLLCDSNISEMDMYTNSEENDTLMTFSDFCLIGGFEEDKRIFRLHRCVLAMGSPVFRAILRSNMKENLTACMKITSFSANCVEKAVKHIYGVETSIAPELYHELYRFAHQYQIPSLLNEARQGLIEMINDSTCVPILQFSAIYEDVVLRHFSVTYISRCFSSLVSHEETREAFNQLSEEVFCSLIESDVIQATELEILLTCLRWIVKNNNAKVDALLRRVRWKIMLPTTLEAILSEKLHSLSPSTFRYIQSVTKQESKVDDKKATQPQRVRRYIRQPNAALWLPLVALPKRAVTSEQEIETILKNRKEFGRYRRISTGTNYVETEFDYAQLRWNFRANMTTCQANECTTPRVSASLWLEEDDYGSIWSSDDDGNPLGNILPLRVSAQFMIWDAQGGHLRTRPFEVVFYSSGWTGGWTVQDLLGGHDKTEDFIQSVRKKNRGMQAVQIAVDIETCRPL